MNRSRIIVTAAIVTGLFAASLYASPYWELHRLHSAIQHHDADAVAEQVDFPSLRESVKGQLMAVMGNEAKNTEAAANPFAVMGQALAMAFLNPLVDAMVSPAGVIAMLESGKAKLPENGAAGDSGERGRKVDYAIAYRGWNRIAVAAKSEDGGSFIFRREGLWRWKLSGIELPRGAAGRTH
ncbi:DUF2939 domain-containing protein [Massilia sp. LXY-6]|uniref:DUF2939 domain-containing protein n=1 Tax=Massilia sp. LXY-6 TaxID=3379823 RepID=UPI003EE12C18